MTAPPPDDAPPPPAPPPDPWAGDDRWTPEDEAAFSTREPHDSAAEAVVLGSMMASRDAIAEVIEHLSAADFYVPANQLIYSAMLDLYVAGEPTDPVAVLATLTKLGMPKGFKRAAVDLAGGAPYLHTLYAAAASPLSTPYYARIVREKAIRRGLADAGRQVTHLALHELTAEVSDVADAAQAAVFAVTERGIAEDYRPIAELFEPTIAEIQAIDEGAKTGMGVPSGFADLDRMTHGFHPGQMIVIAARPSIGKSTLAGDVLRTAAVRRRLPSVMFSLEMGATELVTRLLSAEARVGLDKLRGGGLTETDWGQLSMSGTRVSSAPLFIDDSPDLTIMSIRAKCRRLKQRHGLRLVVLDYLQLLSGGLDSRRNDNRQVEVSGFSRSLKLLAKELAVPVIVLAQLNRGPEQRTDKKPMLSDLRESGSIENDADMVILIHREDFYDKESARAGEADLIIAKHRNGPTGVITVAFQGHYSRFVDLASDTWGGGGG